MEKQINRKKVTEPSYSKGLKASEKYLINDIATGSKAMIPLQVDAGQEVEIVQLDGGLIQDLPEGKHCCDNLVFTLDSTVQNLKITWLIELKGTKNDHEAKHAIKQIVESIEYLNNSVEFPQAAKYLKQRDYVFAAVAGAPDKTLPVLNNEDLKMLCRRMYSLSGQRKQVKDMFMLFCYIKPNKNCSKAAKRGNKAPYDIQCYSNSAGYIPYPSMLLELLK